MHLLRTIRLLPLLGALALTPACSDGGDDDAEDLCPDDPAKTAPGACGCGVSDADTNGDGLPDCFDAKLDLCPDDAAKTSPGACGCGVTDADTNGNGIPDCLDSKIDLCPDDPAKQLPGFCGCGASDADTNGNGIPDCIDPGEGGGDLCPDDPNKVLPGVCGCGVSDADTNANGLPDCLDSRADLCPKDPAKTAPGRCGCGVPDSDLMLAGQMDCAVIKNVAISDLHSPSIAIMEGHGDPSGHHNGSEVTPIITLGGNLLSSVGSHIVITASGAVVPVTGVDLLTWVTPEMLDAKTPMRIGLYAASLGDEPAPLKVEALFWGADYPTLPSPDPETDALAIVTLYEGKPALGEWAFRGALAYTAYPTGTRYVTLQISTPGEASEWPDGGVISIVAPQLILGERMVRFSNDVVTWSEWMSAKDAPTKWTLAAGNSGRSLLIQTYDPLVHVFRAHKSNTLTVFHCGDGQTTGPEACDDGNTVDGDGCSADCLLVEPNYLCPTRGPCHLIECGDGIADWPEQCDDGNDQAGDGCSADCSAKEPGYFCPYGGGACHEIICGDGVPEWPEECDDGNDQAGDGCSADCLAWEPGYYCPYDGGPCLEHICGDGIVVGSEDCDDGNIDDGDGCSADCEDVEPGYTCPNNGGACSPVTCGDGTWTPPFELCDDGNTEDGDGCSAECMPEPDYYCMGGTNCQKLCTDGKTAGSGGCTGLKLPTITSIDEYDPPYDQVAILAVRFVQTRAWYPPGEHCTAAYDNTTPSRYIAIAITNNTNAPQFLGAQLLFSSGIRYSFYEAPFNPLAPLDGCIHIDSDDAPSIPAKSTRIMVLTDLNAGIDSAIGMAYAAAEPIDD